jgi:membrane protein implicated in regulation of membrane protease activity
MLYLVAILCPPLAMLFVGRPFFAIFTFLTMLVSIVFIFSLPLVWLIFSVVAILVVADRRRSKQHAELIKAMKSNRDS